MKKDTSLADMITHNLDASKKIEELNDELQELKNDISETDNYVDELIQEKAKLEREIEILWSVIKIIGGKK